MDGLVSIQLELDRSNFDKAIADIQKSSYDIFANLQLDTKAFDKQMSEVLGESYNAIATLRLDSREFQKSIREELNKGYQIGIIANFDGAQFTRQLSEATKLKEVKVKAVLDTGELDQKLKGYSVTVKGNKNKDECCEAIASAIEQLASSIKSIQPVKTTAIKEGKREREKEKTEDKAKDDYLKQNKTLLEKIEKNTQKSLIGNLLSGLFIGLGQNLTKDLIDYKKLADTIKSQFKNVKDYGVKSGQRLGGLAGLDELGKNLDEIVSDSLVKSMEESVTASELIINFSKQLASNFDKIKPEFEKVGNKLKNPRIYLEALQLAPPKDGSILQIEPLRQIGKAIAPQLSQIVSKRREKGAQDKGLELVLKRAQEIYVKNLEEVGTLNPQELQKGVKAAEKLKGKVKEGVDLSVVKMGKIVGVDAPKAVHGGVQELVITVGGYAGHRNAASGLRIAGDIAQQNVKEGKYSQAAIGIANPDTDIKPESMGQAATKMQGLLSSLTKPVLRGFSKDAVEMAAQAVSAIMVNPEIKIKLVGESGGGFVTEEATHLLNKLGFGSNVSGAAFGTPNFIGGFNPENFKKYIAKDRAETLGYETHQVYAPLGFADVKPREQNLRGVEGHPIENYMPLDVYQEFVHGKIGKSSVPKSISAEDIGQIKTATEQLLNSVDGEIKDIINNLKAVAGQIEDAELPDDKKLIKEVEKFQKQLTSIIDNEDLLKKLKQYQGLIQTAESKSLSLMIEGDRSSLQSLLADITTIQLDLLKAGTKAPEMLKGQLEATYKSFGNIKAVIGNPLINPNLLKYKAIKELALKQASGAYESGDYGQLKSINKDLGKYIKEITINKQFEGDEEAQKIKNNLIDLKTSIIRDLSIIRKSTEVGALDIIKAPQESISLVVEKGIEGLKENITQTFIDFFNQGLSFNPGQDMPDYTHEIQKLSDLTADHVFELIKKGIMGTGLAGGAASKRALQDSLMLTKGAIAGLKGAENFAFSLMPGAKATKGVLQGVGIPLALGAAATQAPGGQALIDIAQQLSHTAMEPAIQAITQGTSTAIAEAANVVIANLPRIGQHAATMLLENLQSALATAIGGGGEIAADVAGLFGVGAITKKIGEKVLVGGANAIEGSKDAPRLAPAKELEIERRTENFLNIAAKGLGEFANNSQKQAQKMATGILRASEQLNQLKSLNPVKAQIYARQIVGASEEALNTIDVYYEAISDSTDQESQQIKQQLEQNKAQVQKALKSANRYLALKPADDTPAMTAKEAVRVIPKVGEEFESKRKLLKQTSDPVERAKIAKSILAEGETARSALNQLMEKLIPNVNAPSKKALEKWAKTTRTYITNALKEAQKVDTTIDTSGIGAASIDGVIVGLQSKVGQLQQAGQLIGEILETSTKQKLDIRSPSGVFEEIALNVTAGVFQGIERSLSLIDKSGIMIGRSLIDATNKSLDIHSPSGKGKKTGFNWVLGIAKGILENLGIIKKSEGEVNEYLIKSGEQLLSHRNKKAAEKAGLIDPDLKEMQRQAAARAGLIPDYKESLTVQKRPDDALPFLKQNEKLAGEKGKSIGAKIMEGIKSGFGVITTVWDDLKKGFPLLDKVQSSVFKIGGAIAGYIALNFGFMQLQQVYQSIQQIYLEFDKTRTTLIGISKSSEEFKRSFGFIKEMSDNLSLPISGLIKQYTALKTGLASSTDLDSKIVDSLVYSIEKFAKSRGYGAETIERVMSAFSQVAGKGQAYSEEIKGQIAEAMPEFLPMIARSFNADVPEFTKMMEQGIAASELFTNLEKQMRVETGGIEIPRTLTNSMMSFQKSVEDIQIAIGDIINPSLITFYETFSKVIDKTKDSLTGLVKGGMEILKFGAILGTLYAVKIGFNLLNAGAGLLMPELRALALSNAQLNVSFAQLFPTLTSFNSALLLTNLNTARANILNFTNQFLNIPFLFTSLKNAVITGTNAIASFLSQKVGFAAFAIAATLVVTAALDIANAWNQAGKEARDAVREMKKGVAEGNLTPENKKDLAQENRRDKRENMPFWVKALDKMDFGLNEFFGGKDLQDAFITKDIVEQSKALIYANEQFSQYYTLLDKIQSGQDVTNKEIEGTIAELQNQKSQLEKLNPLTAADVQNKADAIAATEQLIQQYQKELDAMEGITKTYGLMKKERELYVVKIKREEFKALQDVDRALIQNTLTTEQANDEKARITEERLKKELKSQQDFLRKMQSDEKIKANKDYRIKVIEAQKEIAEIEQELMRQGTEVLRAEYEKRKSIIINTLEKTNQESLLRIEQQQANQIAPVVNKRMGGGYWDEARADYELAQIKRETAIATTQQNILNYRREMSAYRDLREQGLISQQEYSTKVLEINRSLTSTNVQLWEQQLEAQKARIDEFLRHIQSQYDENIRGMRFKLGAQLGQGLAPNQAELSDLLGQIEQTEKAIAKIQNRPNQDKMRSQSINSQLSTLEQQRQKLISGAINRPISFDDLAILDRELGKLGAAIAPLEKQKASLNPLKLTGKEREELKGYEAKLATLKNSYLGVVVAQREFQINLSGQQRSRNLKGLELHLTDEEMAVKRLESEKQTNTETLNLRKYQLKELDRLNRNKHFSDQQYAEKRRGILEQISQLETTQVDNSVELEKARLKAIEALRAREMEILGKMQDIRGKNIDLQTQELDRTKQLKEAFRETYTRRNELIQQGLTQQQDAISKLKESQSALKELPERRKELKGDLAGREALKREEEFLKARRDRLSGLLGLPGMGYNPPDWMLNEKQRELDAKLAQEKLNALQQELAIQREMLALEQESARLSAEKAAQEAEVAKAKVDQNVQIILEKLNRAKLPEEKARLQDDLAIAIGERQIADKSYESAKSYYEKLQQIQQGQAYNQGLQGQQQYQQAGMDVINTNPYALPGFKLNARLPQFAELPVQKYQPILNQKPVDLSSYMRYQPQIKPPSMNIESRSQQWRGEIEAAIRNVQPAIGNLEINNNINRPDNVDDAALARRLSKEIVTDVKDVLSMTGY